MQQNVEDLETAPGQLVPAACTDPCIEGNPLGQQSQVLQQGDESEGKLQFKE